MSSTGTVANAVMAGQSVVKPFPSGRQPAGTLPQPAGSVADPLPGLDNSLPAVGYGSVKKSIGYHVSQPTSAGVGVGSSSAMSSVPMSYGVPQPTSAGVGVGSGSLSSHAQVEDQPDFYQIPGDTTLIVSPA